MVWIKQGAATIAAVTLKTGETCRVVLVGSRENPKGAVLVKPGSSGDATTETLESRVEDIFPSDLVSVLCMQERLYGASGLPAPELA